MAAMQDDTVGLLCLAALLIIQKRRKRRGKPQEGKGWGLGIGAWLMYHEDTSVERTKV